MTRGKFYLLTTVLLIAASFGLFAGGIQELSEPVQAAEQQEAEPLSEINIIINALKGPSGFAAAKMINENFQPGFGVNAEYTLAGSPIEAVTKMTSGEIDAAFLPVNTAAKLYTKGVGFKLAAVSGLGSLYLLSSDPEVRDWSSLKGKTIYLTGKGATPDYLIRYLLIENGLEPDKDVTLNFTSTPPQIIQLIAAGKADTAFIPQPFAFMAEAKTDAAIVLDPQSSLIDIRGTERPFPFTAFVISERLISERPEAAAAITAALGESISWVTSNPEEASAVIESIGIMGAAIAKPAIPLCGVEFISAVDSKSGVEDFLQMLLELDPVSVGGKLPDEGFYFENK